VFGYSVEVETNSVHKVEDPADYLEAIIREAQKQREDAEACGDLLGERQWWFIADRLTSAALTLTHEFDAPVRESHNGELDAELAARLKAEGRRLAATRGRRAPRCTHCGAHPQTVETTAACPCGRTRFEDDGTVARWVQE